MCEFWAFVWNNFTRLAFVVFYSLGVVWWVSGSQSSPRTVVLRPLEKKHIILICFTYALSFSVEWGIVLLQQLVITDVN